ncbi:putative glyoxalase superfamily protein PhnB [Paenibacillus phyllosphaerae]|uniref:Bleomycin resistance protein n=1 Tax=Paenibacillus phyllosphaerae TaxID=274593 RepID=A0A7W5B3H2_9BACL|nr:putative glyoxalase superfamily protein PhnB [Paenibacillus phyllosphaerae]
MSNPQPADYSLQSVIPILRMFDVTKALEFYNGYLGFAVDWEHRFEPGMPLYMQMSLGNCILHLSEHHGDCTPGSAIRIATTGVADFHRKLSATHYGYARPGLEETPWGTREIRVGDPFGNRLVFYEPVQ